MNKDFDLGDLVRLRSDGGSVDYYGVVCFVDDHHFDVQFCGLPTHLEGNDRNGIYSFQKTWTTGLKVIAKAK